MHARFENSSHSACRALVTVGLSAVFLLTATLSPAHAADAAKKKLKVVTTSSSYAPVVEYIGGDRVEVTYLVKGYQDPHIVRPKPSMALTLSEADLLVATGLDLEMWLPPLQDRAGNPNIMSGQPGFVSVTAGLEVQERPTSMDRSEGDVHVFGNPHVHTSPLNGKVIAENITVGLKRIDPTNADRYEANLKRFKEEMDRRLFGDELVRVLGSKTLCRLAQRGKLVEFLSKKQYKGAPLLDLLGGWMKEALPLRGMKVITYHKNWTYFVRLFGVEVVGYMEPKPGIPPSPGHILDLVETMKREKVHVVFAANYFDIGKVRRVTEKTGARPVVVALAVDGQDGMDDYFDQFDIWIRALRQGLEATSAAGAGE